MNKKIASILIAGVLFFTSVFSYAQQCPSPTEFLSQTMGQARDVLNKAFPNRWSENGPLCSSNYFNLMTNMVNASGPTTICNSPDAVESILVFGFADSSKVIGLMYLLPTTIERNTLQSLFSRYLRVKLERTEDYPNGNLARLLKNRSGPTWKFLSTNQHFFVEVRTGQDEKNEVFVYDLRALESEKEAFDTCLKEFGR